MTLPVDPRILASAPLAVYYGPGNRKCERALNEMLSRPREGTHVVGSLAGLVLVCAVGLFLYFHVGVESPFPSENPAPELQAPAAGDTNYTDLDGVGKIRELPEATLKSPSN